MYTNHNKQYSNVLEAADNGSLELLQKLLDEGANPNMRDEVPEVGDEYRDWAVESTLVYGETPLMKALYRGFTKCVKMLVSYGADVNVRLGWNVPVTYHTPIEYAYAYCGEEMAKYLIKNGATDVDEKPEYVGPVRTKAQKYWGEIAKCGAEQRKAYYVAKLMCNFYSEDKLAYMEYKRKTDATAYYLKVAEKFAEVIGIKRLSTLIAVPSTIDGYEINREDFEIMQAFNTSNGFYVKGRIAKGDNFLTHVAHALALCKDIKLVDGKGVLADWVKENHLENGWTEDVEASWKSRDWRAMWYWQNSEYNKAFTPENITELYENAEKFDHYSRVVKELEFCNCDDRCAYTLSFIQDEVKQELSYQSR